jgi:UDPglucose 6-dehydrogenase
MRVAMIGGGYVGLVSAACIADFGHNVVCVDQDETKIEALRRGEVPIHEPGLQGLVEANVKEGRLSFATKLAEHVRGAEVVFIAVGTPSRRGDGHADLSYVYSAVKEIAAALDGFTVVVTKSTVPVGTGDEVERMIREARPEANFATVSNPEFLREGAAIHDFKHPDRIVIGTRDERAKKVMAEIYRPLNLNQTPIFYTDRRTAELIKYAANAFLATKITFINEIADLCEKVGGDVQEVARGMGLDNRIGSKFLHAGPGFGGSCFPKDVRALIKTAQDHEVSLRIVEAVALVNDVRKRTMARKVAAMFDEGLRSKTVAVLGLTFKPNTDDVREAPSIALITALQDLGVVYCGNVYDCAESAHAMVISTEWEQFRALDLERLRAVMVCPVMVDLRNVYRPDEMQKHGFAYACIGKPIGLD